MEGVKQGIIGFVFVFVAYMVGVTADACVVHFLVWKDFLHVVCFCFPVVCYVCIGV